MATAHHTRRLASGRPGRSYGRTDDASDGTAALVANLRASAGRLWRQADIWRAEGWEYAASVAEREAALDEERARTLEAGR
jgi:hypothetical protein